MSEPVFRIVSLSDAARVAEIYRPYVRDTVISFEADAPTTDEMAQRIADVTRRYPWLVAEVEGQVVGYAYAGAHRARAAYRWSVDVSAYVDPAFHRRGIGRLLYASLFARLREQGYFNAYAGITLPNAASVGLHEAMGFEPVGVYRGVGFKFGAWHDVGWWQLALRERGLPSEPTPFA